ncbi:hypothetical protein OIO90_006305 [Microbotryomycetes sp. JL221]|nr:hypothetical protein OIO90_006305 [Microbotryomycetes sp. JL221]
MAMSVLVWWFTHRSSRTTTTTTINDSGKDVVSLTGRLRQLSGQTRSTNPMQTSSYKLQLACGETSNDMTQWLNAFDAPSQLQSHATTGCVHETLDPIEATKLYKSAQFQCSAWCVWDLSTREQTGWHISDGCFKRFSSPFESCDEFWNQRPKLDVIKLD